jgi:hypothetical protein
MLIPTNLLDNYHGCGAYLAAFDQFGTLLGLLKIDEFHFSRCPSKPAKRGRLSKAENATWIRARADWHRARDAAYEAWAVELRRWRVPGAWYIDVYDGSSCELVQRMSDGAWQAKDAIDGKGAQYAFGIIGREERDSAFAAEIRLNSPKGELAGTLRSECKVLNAAGLTRPERIEQ